MYYPADLTYGLEQERAKSHSRHKDLLPKWWKDNSQYFTKAKQQYKIKQETIKKAKEVCKTTYEKLNNIPVFNMGKKTPILTILKGIQQRVCYIAGFVSKRWGYL
jgi:1,2-phenylacetyl-CoA epoxidase catalytic subunit